MKNYLDGGEAILEAFRKLKIDYIMSSPGSEWSPVWEALARQKLENRPGPTFVESWHETLAVNMATGYTLMTGRPQAVLLHAGVGMLQGSMGIHGALQNEVPMVVMSGESQTLGEDPDLDIEAQWYGGLTIGGIERFVEPVAKWARAVTSPYTLYETVIRAGEMAQRVPKGPIYLNVALEHMLHDWTPPTGAREVPPAPILRPRAQDVDEVAGLLRNAKRPVIVAETSGGIRLRSRPWSSLLTLSRFPRSTDAPMLTPISRPTIRSISEWEITKPSRMPIWCCWSEDGRLGTRRSAGQPTARSSPSTTTRSRGT